MSVDRRATVREQLAQIASEVGLDYDACVSEGWSLARFESAAAMLRVDRMLETLRSSTIPAPPPSGCEA